MPHPHGGSLTQPELDIEQRGLSGDVTEFARETVSQTGSLTGELSEYLESIIGGEGAISERLKRDKIRAFNELKQNLAERGHYIAGDDPDTATAFSSAGVSALGALQERFLIAAESERTAARTAGVQAFGTLTGIPGTVTAGAFQKSPALAQAQAIQQIRVQGLEAARVAAAGRAESNPWGTFAGQLAGTALGFAIGGPVGAGIGGSIGAGLTRADTTVSRTLPPAETSPYDYPAPSLGGR